MVVTSVDASMLIDGLNRDGVVVLPRYFSEEQLALLQSEADWFLEQPRPWYSTEANAHTSMAVVSPFAFPDEERTRVREMVRAFSQPQLVEACRRYLPEAYIDRIIIHRERAHQEPITEWHVDQQQGGLNSVKFMLYFNDVDARNGAFSYVRGSHHVVKRITQAAAQRGLANTAAHNFEQIRQLAVDLGLDDCQQQFAGLDTHISTDYESDDAYALSAPRGSLLFFDTKGIHRGGVVSEGERYLMRVHCFEPPVRWKAWLKNRLPLTAVGRGRLFW